MTEPAPAPHPRIRVRASLGAVLTILAIAVVLVALAVSRPAASPATSDLGSGSSWGAPASSVGATAKTSPASGSSPAAILPAPRRDDPISPIGRAATIVVVDASAGTAGVALDAERRALATFVDEYGSPDLGLVVHGGPARVLIPLGRVSSASREAAVGALAGVRPGSEPDLEGALALARDQLARAPEGERRVLVIVGASADPAIDDLYAAVSGIAVDEFAVSVGRGPQEAQLSEISRGGEGYLAAPESASLVERLADVRLAVDRGVMLTEERGSDVSRGSLDIEPNTSLVRFSVYDPGSGPVAVTDPQGRRLDASTHAAAVSVRDGDDRVTIAVEHPEAGAWTFDAPAGGRPHVEAFGGRASNPAIRALARGDEGDEVDVGVMDPSLAGEPATGTAVMSGPGGKELTIPLELYPQGSEDFGMSGGATWAARLPSLSPAGSWIVRIRVSGTRADGPFGYEFVRGLFVPPRVDTDGDGIRDVVERGYGLDPKSAADAGEDPDLDGLSNVQELTQLDSNPFRYDTDEGGENDGSEVRQGRDPLDPADDVRPVSCLQQAVVPGSSPLPSPRPSPAAMPRDRELEATLPDEIAGEPTTKFSIVGPPEWHGFIGGLWSALVLCAGRTADDLTVAYAVAPRIGNWSVVAIEVRGTSGRRLADIWAHEVQPGGEDSLGLHEEVIDGRRILVSRVWALYPHDDALYMVINLTFGDFPSPPPVEPPPFEELVRGVIGDLPAP